jgi:BMFP domain-containing protein YqiC
MRNTLVKKTQTGAEEPASETVARSESEEKEKKEQTELEEWANKVHKDAAGAAAAMGGELKLSSRETLEIRLKRLSDEVTRKVLERLRKEQEAKPDDAV